MAPSSGHFLPPERWTIELLSRRDERSMFYSMRKEMIVKGGERSWRLFAASAFWVFACPFIIILWIPVSLVSDLSVTIGIIAGGLLFIIGLSRYFQSHFVSRRHRRNPETG